MFRFGWSSEILMSLWDLCSQSINLFWHRKYIQFDLIIHWQLYTWYSFHDFEKFALPKYHCGNWSSSSQLCVLWWNKRRWNRQLNALQSIVRGSQFCCATFVHELWRCTVHQQSILEEGKVRKALEGISPGGQVPAPNSHQYWD